MAIRSGDIDITATDDCLNAANSDLTGYRFTMDISGSTINAYTSGGDGFDSNGSLTISGGVIAVWTANTADNQPLDADGTITVSGGTVLAAGGSSGMGMNLSASQPYVLYGSTGGMGGGRGQGQQSALAAKGSTLTIQDASGNSVYSAAAPCNVNFAFFSSPKLTLGSSYENGCFGPNDPVTREQLAAILYRYAQYRGLDVSQTGSIGGFADNSSVSGYARTAMAWANGAGLISGMGDNTLAPRGTATRGQAAVILMGLDKLAGL